VPGELFTIAQREIVEFHVAIQRWFSDKEVDEKTFERIARALAPDFSMTTPDGRQIAEPLVSDWLLKGRASRDKVFRIWIERFRPVIEEGDLAVVIYDECQHCDGRDTRRHVTAVFKRALAAPQGVQWVRVHETWAAKLGGPNATS
jgi:hypothetical protein